MVLLRVNRGLRLTQFIATAVRVFTVTLSFRMSVENVPGKIYLSRLDYRSQRVRTVRLCATNAGTERRGCWNGGGGGGVRFPGDCELWR